MEQPEGGADAAQSATEAKEQGGNLHTSPKKSSFSFVHNMSPLSPSSSFASMKKPLPRSFTSTTNQYSSLPYAFASTSQSSSASASFLSDNTKSSELFRALTDSDSPLRWAVLAEEGRRLLKMGREVEDSLAEPLQGRSVKIEATSRRQESTREGEVQRWPTGKNETGEVVHPTAVEDDESLQWPSETEKGEKRFVYNYETAGGNLQGMGKYDENSMEENFLLCPDMKREALPCLQQPSLKEENQQWPATETGDKRFVYMSDLAGRESQSEFLRQKQEQEKLRKQEMQHLPRPLKDCRRVLAGKVSDALSNNIAQSKDGGTLSDDQSDLDYDGFLPIGKMVVQHAKRSVTSPTSTTPHQQLPPLKTPYPTHTATSSEIATSHISEKSTTSSSSLVLRGKKASNSQSVDSQFSVAQGEKNYGSRKVTVIKFLGAANSAGSSSLHSQRSSKVGPKKQALDSACAKSQVNICVLIF
jgi:hypothetical protein